MLKVIGRYDPSRNVRVERMYFDILDGRANQSLVLKTQWQGWRDRNTEDKMTSLEQHRALLQEAVAIVVENRKEESKLLSTNSDDLAIATQLLSELQRQQELECKGLLSFADKVNCMWISYIFEQ